MKTEVHSFESFGTVDGPGIRFIVFFQGCPLRCAYCHNPDTWKIGNGTVMESDAIVTEVLKYKTYIKDGGVTLSGGEPLLQIDAVICLLKKLKEAGLHTCVDTCGITFEEHNEEIVKKFDELLKVTDLFLLDIKHIDEVEHRALTKHTNINTLAFARYLNEQHKPVWIRHVLVPGITTDTKYLERLRQFLNTLQNIEKIEVLPYHTMGLPKYEQLGIGYPLQGVESPTKQQIELANRILKNKEK